MTVAGVDYDCGYITWIREVRGERMEQSKAGCGEVVATFGSGDKQSISRRGCPFRTLQGFSSSKLRED